MRLLIASIAVNLAQQKRLLKLARSSDAVSFSKEQRERGVLVRSLDGDKFYHDPAEVTLEELEREFWGSEGARRLKVVRWKRELPASPPQDKADFYHVYEWGSRDSTSLVLDVEPGDEVWIDSGLPPLDANYIERVTAMDVLDEKARITPYMFAPLEFGHVQAKSTSCYPNDASGGGAFVVFVPDGERGRLEQWLRHVRSGQAPLVGRE